MVSRIDSSALLDISKFPNCGEVVGSRFQDVLELRNSLVVPAHFKQGAAERYAGGEIGRMLLQTRPADANGFLELACAPMLFCELGKSNRRRILLDPASKFFNPLTVRHERYGIATAVGDDRTVRP